MKNILFLILLSAAIGSGCVNINRVERSCSYLYISQNDSIEVIPACKWKRVARKNDIKVRTGESRSPVIVLGHYPEYVELAATLKVESMQIPMNEWDAMTPEKQWSTTTGFFDSKIKSRHNFRLATPVTKARPNSFYVRELCYLSGKGYKLSHDGLWLVKQ